ncbi:hypothetical protein CPB83DRAFT_605493 [Crepidotus variabilis]|uniref:DUF6570 domain-containing protein n=1 Tax=Crepidotus variabilis TaxID=179855 RepID=A0A9P6E8W5_9AGAR|nr:hypothetical protein CPB83DRAFT_605493 [Crepidotus variabilis]
MVDGLLMPPHSSVLAATIGITFVTPHKVVNRDLQGLFRVKRERVRDALKWLQANNQLYSDIIISEDRLSELPEDDVPTEIVSTTRVSADVEAVLREEEGYVPLDVLDEGEFHAERLSRSQISHICYRPH